MEVKAASFRLEDVREKADSATNTIFTHYQGWQTLSAQTWIYHWSHSTITESLCEQRTRSLKWKFVTIFGSPERSNRKQKQNSTAQEAKEQFKSSLSNWHSLLLCCHAPWHTSWHALSLHPTPFTFKRHQDGAIVLRKGPIQVRTLTVTWR